MGTKKSTHSSLAIGVMLLGTLQANMGRAPPFLFTAYEGARSFRTRRSAGRGLEMMQWKVPMISIV